MKRIVLEAIIYGGLSASFAAAFFFGMLSPMQVLKSDVLRVTQPIVTRRTSDFNTCLGLKIPKKNAAANDAESTP